MLGTLTIAQKVMLGTCLLGAVAGVVGSFAVLRRRALVGDMLAHTALPGLCLAFLIMGNRNFLGLMLGAFGAGLLGVAAVTVITRWTRTKEEAAIGIVLSTFFGAGIALRSVIARLPIGGKAGLDSFLFGQAATMRSSDLVVISVTSLFCLVVIVALYKEFKIFSFDPDFARALGMPAFWLDLALMALLALVVMVGLPVVGVVLTAAMVIIPGATARFWSERLGQMLLGSAIVGATMGIGGTSLSITYRLPTGPVIVLTGAVLFLASMLFAPRRGVVASAWSELKLRHRMARENLLRSLYELSESELPKLPVVDIEQIQAQRAWSSIALGRLIRRAVRLGLVEPVGSGVRLTAAGLAQAASLTRTHRLWELFLIERANIASDHVDRDADLVEHLLPPEIVEMLEEKLEALGQLPSSTAIPVSPHGLSTVPRSEHTRG